MASSCGKETHGCLASSYNDISSENVQSSGTEQCTLRRRCVANQHLEGVGILHASPELADVDRGPLVRLLSVPLDRAEGLAEELWAAPSKAFNKAGEALGRAEGLAEELWTVPSKALNKAGEALDRAEEIAEDILSVPSKALTKAEEMAGEALDRAEELAGELLSVPGRALNRAEEMAGDALDRAESIAKKVWQVVHHHHLPAWLQDNHFLLHGHRPPLNSFRACFGSIFRIHTETVNIWTHLLGFLAFICVGWLFLTKPSATLGWQEKAVFSAFFMGAVCCLGFSFTFHTCICHSEHVNKIFSKLDYCGISLLTIGSFVPWLYYSFYCQMMPQIVYNCLILVLGSASIVISMWDKFATPKFRPIRAGTFVALGLSGAIPALHIVLTDGLWRAVEDAALGWLLLMAFLYILGAVIYACRVPERLWPGKFDIWFQSHQIFHVFVVAAAFVHLHGVSGIAAQKLDAGGRCDSSDVQEFSS